MRSHSKFLTSFLRCKKGEPINWSAGRHLSPNLNRLLGQSLILSSSLWGGKKFCSITNPHLIFETCLRHFGICSLRYDRKRSMKIGWITRSSWTHFLQIPYPGELILRYLTKFHFQWVPIFLPPSNLPIAQNWRDPGFRPGPNSLGRYKKCDSTA